MLVIAFGILLLSMLLQVWSAAQVPPFSAEATSPADPRG